MAKNKLEDGRVSRIRAAILDFGEVLCYLPTPADLRRMAELFRIDLSDFLEVYVRSRGPYDQGLLTAEEYWQGFARDAGVRVDATLIETLRSWDTEMWSRINVEMADWVERLKAKGVTMALLSNMPHDMAAHARRNFAWLAHFDHQILSCEVRLIKPDPAIFAHSLQRVGEKPEETLFVDDRDANIEAARAAGMRAIRYESTERLRADLQEMGFGILPNDGVV